MISQTPVIARFQIFATLPLQLPVECREVDRRTGAGFFGGRFCKQQFF
jgi:hypothetical protein